MANEERDTHALTSEVESAARALIDVLARGLVPSSSSTSTLRSSNTTIRENIRLSGTSGLTSQPTPEPENRVRQALKRQFPSMFGTEHDQPRGKKRFSVAKPGNVKKTDFQIYVLAEPSLFTPKGDEDLELVRAGLGKRLLTVPDSFKHSEIVTLLEEEFPKLKTLQGGWMFYKSTGGGGRRKLSIIPTDSDGYSTRLLKSMSNNGKNILFVVPLQEQLSIEPLPFDSVEFAKMPQSNCMKCGRKMPLPLLPLHIEECKVTEMKSVTDVTILDDEDENVSGPTDQPSSRHTDLEQSSQVLGRIKCQIKDLRKGIKDTGIWPLLSQRLDSHHVVFPRESVRDITSQEILQKIVWPKPVDDVDDEDNDDSISVEKMSVITGYMRSFIEEASPTMLNHLMKFWVGWELPEENLVLELVNAKFPVAHTCFNALRLPCHYQTYAAFKVDMLMCLNSVNSGFGLV
ncbi:E3 ubiquitin-protein ligase UPL1 [Labeo rohita]|uniref:E3 ubiquitin-protein ligase UPL1 n=1 Tax=Labeo rohita TaxID=84645 RepID=A0ABQ8L3K5_LABRO|nr:E3 ubiquitin-protein ligase UPL1 [Labeo rohita]